MKISVRELMFRIKPKIYKANKEQFDRLFLIGNPKRFVEINKEDVI